MKHLHYLALLFILISVLTFSCKKDDMKNYQDLNNLPVDTGGIQTAFPLGTNEAVYGYYIYEPSVKGPEYPLLLFLHGAGEKGNSSIDPNVLDDVLVNGPPRLIQLKKWNPKYPMIVVSPQCHESNWSGTKIHELIKFIIANYNINVNRIYVTGLSMGGYGTFTYLTTTADSCYAAAAVPICGGGNTSKVEGMKHIPVWAFHGEEDQTVYPIKSIEMVEAINAVNPPVRAKLTIYPGIAHNSWSMTYDGSGMGEESSEYDAFNISIYDWMFQYSK